MNHARAGCCVVAFGLVLIACAGANAQLQSTIPELNAKGPRLTTADGKPVRLRGVNIPSLEWGQGDHLSQSLDVAVDDWHANIVRLPLSQDRWFGRTKELNDDGARYRKTVHDFVDKAAAKGCYVILDLHWSNVGEWGQHIGQHKMPDTNSVAFWADLAPAFANNPAVLFGLYNEPYGVSWEIWRDGGKVVEEKKGAPDVKFEYDTPGIQKLLGVCRALGAKNVAVAGGLDWGYDLSGITHGSALSDPNGHGVVYDTHIYPQKKDWDNHITPVIGHYPVLVGEIGTGPEGWLPKAIDYIHEHDLPWTAWCMHTGARPCLIKDWDYNPTPFGEMIKSALRNH